jgi:hypothetical protein
VSVEETALKTENLPGKERLHSPVREIYHKVEEEISKICHAIEIQHPGPVFGATVI